LIRYNIPNFFKNLWMFRKVLYNYRWYAGHSAILPFLETALTDMSNKMYVYGHEEEVSRLKKIAKMRRAVEITQRFNQYNFIDLAELELGSLHEFDYSFKSSKDHPGCFEFVDNMGEVESAHNSKVYARSQEIEAEMWIELWEIIKGQDVSEYKKILDSKKKDPNSWNKWFDGSGLRGWWD